ncbi:MAG: hypothetical protein O3C21_15075, partial [Verrucomicrobia bacterium]|nr:hypothetical protein [Verrucomicrobiota bacterium]
MPGDDCETFLQLYLVLAIRSHANLCYTIINGRIASKPKLEFHEVMNQAKHPERETIPSFSQTLAMLVVLVLSCAIFGSCASPAMPKKASGHSLSEQQFLTNVKPLVESRCSWCHSDSNPAG